MTYIFRIPLSKPTRMLSDAGEVENGESFASPSTVRQLRFACVHIIRIYIRIIPSLTFIPRPKKVSVALAASLRCTSLHSGGWQIATCYQSLDMSGQDISSPSQSLSLRPGASRRRRSSRTPLPITICCHHRIHHCPLAFTSVIVVSFITMLVHHTL